MVRQYRDRKVVGDNIAFSCAASPALRNKGYRDLLPGAGRYCVLLLFPFDYGSSLCPQGGIADIMWFDTAIASPSVLLALFIRHAAAKRGILAKEENVAPGG